MIRPSQHFRPNQIAALDLWLRADTVAGADNDAIQTWVDESGAGHDAAQASATLRPLLKVAIINNKPILRFDGSNDAMTSTIIAGAAKTVFVVGIKRSAPSTTAMCLISLGFNAQLLFTFTTSFANYGYNRNAATASVDLGGAPQSAGVFAFNFASASSVKHWVTGGGVGGTFDPDDSASTSVRCDIGWANGGALNEGDFDVAEVIVYNAALSIADTNRVGSYLASKYALTWALAS